MIYRIVLMVENIWLFVVKDSLTNKNEMVLISCIKKKNFLTKQNG